MLRALLLSMVGFASVSYATTYTWDPAGNGLGSGGMGIWNTTSSELYTGTADTTWPNTTSYVVDFAGTAGTVTLGSAITAGT